MSPRADDGLGRYLAPEEAVETVTSGRFAGGATWADGTIAVTDRRVLCVDDDGGFLTIGFDEIGSIAGQPRTSTTVRGNDHRLLAAGGLILATVGIIGVFGFSTGPSSLALAVVTGVGLLATTSSWQAEGTPAWASMPTVTGGPSEHAHDGQIRRRVAAVLPEGIRGAAPLVLGGWGIAAVGTPALLLSGPLILVAVLVTVGGLALVEFARRHEEALDGIEVVRRRELELTVTTNDGRTIALRSQPTAAIHQELSKVAFGGDVAADPVEIPTD